MLVCPDKRVPEENKHNAYLVYTDKVDAWACGVLAFELLVGYPPFGMSTREASVRAVLYEAPKIPQWLPPAAADFIKWALTKAPAHRPTVSQLLQHSWILAFKCASACVHVLRGVCHMLLHRFHAVTCCCVAPVPRFSR